MARKRLREDEDNSFGILNMNPIIPKTEVMDFTDEIFSRTSIRSL